MAAKDIDPKMDFLRSTVVRPERFELPTFWFVARRSIQLSYGRISFLCASQQLTAGSALSSTATFGASEKRIRGRAASLSSSSQHRGEPGEEVSGSFCFGGGGSFRRIVYFFHCARW
jgi:hypothetical protein